MENEAALEHNEVRKTPASKIQNGSPLISVGSEGSGEDPNTTSRSIEEIRKWITEEDNFSDRTDDSFIQRYLVVCQFNVEVAKRLIRHQHNVRKKFQNWFTRSEENETMVKDLLSRKLVCVMNYAGKSKENIVICHASNQRRYSQETFLGTTFSQMGEILYEDPGSQRRGLIIVGDASGLSLANALKLTPGVCYKLASLFLPSAPVLIKGVHILNATYVACKALQVAKYFLSKELQNTIFIHNGLSSLYKHVSPYYLPSEFGGSAGPIQHFIG